jgi:general secretion pathway protein K
VLPAERASLRRLCELVGVSPATADKLAEALRLAQPGSSADLAASASLGAGIGTSAAMDTPREPPLMPERIDDLGWLGVPADAVQALKPYLVLLPRATPVNLNTASRLVIAAVVPGADLASAERLVQLRQRNPLKRREDALAPLGQTAVLDAARVGVSSNFFEVTGRLRIDEMVVMQRSLVERTTNLEVRLLSTQRLPAGSTMSAEGG